MLVIVLLSCTFPFVMLPVPTIVPVFVELFGSDNNFLRDVPQLRVRVGRLYAPIMGHYFGSVKTDTCRCHKE